MALSPQSAFVIPPPQPGSGQTACSSPHLARQPIFDHDRNTYGYELLFRCGPENIFLYNDRDSATCHTIDISLLLGSTELTGRRLAFVNCTRNILLHDYITLLPREQIVIEVLEDVPADEETLAACDRLRRAGYRIALDDYVPTPDTLRLLPFANIVKVDFLATDTALQTSIASDMHRRGVRLLAEKVETRAQFHLAQRLGYQYFQGFFFCKPESVTRQDTPCSKLAHIQILSLANQDSFDVDRLEQAILREPSLCYRLLRYLNSAAFGLTSVHSVRHALLLLGQQQIRKWVSIVVAISLSSDCSQELIYNALVRAHCCEALAAFGQQDCNGAFMVGLLSLLDAILDRSMEVVIAQLPLTPECKRALAGGATPLGTLLRVAIGCERGAWEAVSAFASETALPEGIILNIHRDSCRWASGVLQ